MNDNTVWLHAGDVSNITFNDEVYVPDNEGFVQVPANAVDTFLSHGFRRLTKEEAASHKDNPDKANFRDKSKK